MTRRVFASVGSLAIAAGLCLVVWLRLGPAQPGADRPFAPELARSQTNPSPALEKSNAEAPKQPPVRLGDELSKAESALRDSSKPIAESASAAPIVLSRLGDLLSARTEASSEFDSTRASLIELPEAARVGLQPVTETTQKAFARLMKDVGLQASMKAE